MDSEIAQLFLAHSIKRLRQMTAHIESCFSRLSDDQVWSRGATHENSIGNLILHICGNARQWIGHGVGEEPDVRNRPSEFSARGGLSRAELLSHLHSTVDHAVAIIEKVTPERMVERINPQHEVVSVLDAIYQVVGHVQLHTGQIIFAAKILAGEDLGLYRPQPVSK